MPTHEEIDRLSLAYHRAIADKLRADPGVMELARANWGAGRRGSTRGEDGTRRNFETWSRLVEQGDEASVAVLLEESDRATALRHTAPFVGVLTQAERWAIRSREFARHHGAA